MVGDEPRVNTMISTTATIDANARIDTHLAWYREPRAGDMAVNVLGVAHRRVCSREQADGSGVAPDGRLSQSAARQFQIEGRARNDMVFPSDRASRIIR